MSVTLTKEQRELRAVVRGFFADHSDEATVRRLMATEQGYDPAVWTQLGEQLGIQGMAVPEEYGGSGFSHVDLGIVFEEAGGALLCAPLLSTALAAEAVLAGGDESARKELLPRLAAGSAVGTVALLETAGDWRSTAITTRARRRGDRWLLSGHKRHVLDGHTSELIIVSAVVEDGIALFAVEAPAEGLTVTPVPTLDQTRKQAHLELRETPARLLGSPDAGQAVDRLLQAGAVLLAAEQVGAAARALKMAVEYSRTRSQYGRLIGSFQALKHICADVHTDTEAARSAAYAGLLALDENPAELALASFAAKVFCSRTAMSAAAACIQVHGAIGFTWEHPAHLYFKRAKGSEALFGTPSAHREMLAATLMPAHDADVAGPVPADPAEIVDSAEDAAFRAEVRGWLAEHLVGEFAEHLGVGSADDAEHWDVRLRWEQELAAGGWLGLTWPKEYGGRGAPLEHEIIFNEECARAQAPYRVGVHGQDLFGPTLLMFGNDEQKTRFLPKILAVEQFWGQGFSEPEAGSDLASLRTRAHRDGDEWVLDGQKIWMTFGEYADWLYVLCRTDPDLPRHKGLSLLAVPVDQPGVEIRPIRNMAGAAEFCEAFLTGARTGAENVIGAVNDGWRVALGALAVERGSLLMPVQLGFEREIDRAMELARTRGVPAGLRERLVDSWIAVRVMRATNERTIAEVKLGQEPGDQATTIKLFASVEHQRLLELATEVLAEDASVTGDGYELEHLQRAFLLSRAETIYGGTSQVQRNIIAERLLGMPREPRPA